MTTSLTIYSVGNVEFLRSIFNGIAMICGSDSFPTLISVGMLLGFLFVCWECVFNGTRAFNLQHMLVACIGYMCMFGPTTSVVITDRYTTAATTATVDNVPLGIAACGSIVSRIGYRLAVMIETAYHPTHSVSTVTEGGYVEPLRILNTIREFNFSDEVYNSINLYLGQYTDTVTGKTQESNVKQAVLNYMASCTFEDVARGAKSTTKIYTANSSTSLKSENQALTVYLPIKNSQSKNVFNCSEGYTILSTAINGATSDDSIWAAVAKGVGGALAKDQTSAGLTGVLNSLGQTALDAQKLVEKRIALNVYGQAAEKHYRGKQDEASAIAINQALEQRNLQWAAEGTMFAQACKAFMSFIEGFCYGIMPVMAFLFVMGSLGIKVVGKFLQMVAWIQLWFPIMAITNLFVLTGATTDMKSVAAENSFYAVNTVLAESANWMGIGGMMLAATPLLALLIISGSSMAFTAVTGRMGGQDHFNEKVVSPDAVSPAPVLAMDPRGSYNEITNGVAAGGSTLLSKLDLKTATSQAATSAETLANAATTNTMQAFSNAISDVKSKTNTSGVTSQIGASLASVWGNDTATALKAAQRLGIASGSQTSLTDAQNAQLGARIGTPKAGDDASIWKKILGGSAQYTTSTQKGQSQSVSDSKEDSEIAEFAAQYSAAARDTISRSLANTYSENGGQSYSDKLDDTVSKAVSEQLSAQRSFSVAKSLNDSTSMGTTTSINVVTSRVRAAGAGQQLTSGFYEAKANMDANEQRNFERRAQLLGQVAGGDLTFGQQMAYMEHLYQTKQYEKFSGFLAQGTGLQLVGTNEGGLSAGSLGVARNVGLSGSTRLRAEIISKAGPGVSEEAANQASQGSNVVAGGMPSAGTYSGVDSRVTAQANQIETNGVAQMATGQKKVQDFAPGLKENIATQKQDISDTNVVVHQLKTAGYNALTAAPPPTNPNRFIEDMAKKSDSLKVMSPKDVIPPI